MLSSLTSRHPQIFVAQITFLSIIQEGFRVFTLFGKQIFQLPRDFLVVVHKQSFPFSAQYAAGISDVSFVETPTCAHRTYDFNYLDIRLNNFSCSLNIEALLLTHSDIHSFNKYKFLSKRLKWF